HRPACLRSLAIGRSPRLHVGVQNDAEATPAPGGKSHRGILATGLSSAAQKSCVRYYGLLQDSGPGRLTATARHPELHSMEYWNSPPGPTETRTRLMACPSAIRPRICREISG